MISQCINAAWPGASPCLDCLGLLLFTGCHKEERAALRWEEGDRQRHCLNLLDSKPWAKQVLLNAPALERLAGLSHAEVS